MFLRIALFYGLVTAEEVAGRVDDIMVERHRDIMVRDDEEAEGFTDVGQPLDELWTWIDYICKRDLGQADRHWG